MNDLREINVADSESTDFMSVSYEIIDNPLKLSPSGQRWFGSVYNCCSPPSGGKALVMGAVTWMAELLARNSEAVYVVDKSQIMLDKLTRSVKRSSNCQIHTLCTDWLGLELGGERVTTLFADNSFAFLDYPESWRRMLKHVSGLMAKDGLLVVRLFSVPHSHKAATCDGLIAKYSNEAEVNFTAMRVEILYSTWNSATFEIDTEAALAKFQRDHAKYKDFIALKGKAGKSNDLETMFKYRDTGAIYYVPPLPQILATFSEYFTIKSVHFGPYELSQYFPLVVATRK